MKQKKAKQVTRLLNINLLIKELNVTVFEHMKGQRN